MKITGQGDVHAVVGSGVEGLELLAQRQIARGAVVLAAFDQDVLKHAMIPAL